MAMGEKGYITVPFLGHRLVNHLLASCLHTCCILSAWAAMAPD
tara:strand:+ start:382 stop:510 length:129 start_codon:yes stop_codon:yes gene_type:complete